MNLRWRIAQFFEIRWWRRYLGKQDKFDYLAWKRHYWQSFLSTIGLDIPVGASVLDAGCGPAGVFILLEKQMVDALDPLLDQYEKSLPHFCKADYPQARFFSEPLETFFPEKKYAYAFCLNALNHMADLPRCLERLSALIEPGGTLTVSIDAHKHAWLNRLFRFVPADILHPHQYDLAAYQAMLAGQGFRLERTILIKKGLIFDYWALVFEKQVAYA